MIPKEDNQQETWGLHLESLSMDSILLVKRCTKPDRKEFQKITMATAIGFAIMGFIGFFVKLIHIPINNIVVGG
ncbi:protein transport protein Sec61 subunit gamma-like [Peromyscus eremicus]|uniref:protein transport protein Sec61 subunit gamma-like n=1 Tax=Peromyscus eremicus TaxID=42410 RepID=UPI0027DE2CF5|nr:protein transport protein Sec61 subunit gamma-like [Peromyscus eremicus]